MSTGFMKMSQNQYKKLGERKHSSKVLLPKKSRCQHLNISLELSPKNIIKYRQKGWREGEGILEKLDHTMHIICEFPSGSAVKNLPAMQETEQAWI